MDHPEDPAGVCVHQSGHPRLVALPSITVRLAQEPHRAVAVLIDSQPTAKLAARVRVFDTGQGRKTDATEAHAVVMVALRTRGLRQLVADEDLTVVQLLTDRRDELSRARTRR